MSEMVEIVYSSRATVDFDEAALKTLLEKARVRNREAGVSGVLLHDAGSFFQVLEGPEEAVTAVYERIDKDPRHDSVTLLRRRTIKERSFDQWAMGFMTSRQRSDELSARLDGYSDFLTSGRFDDFVDSGDGIRPVLEKFRDGRFRQS